MEIRERLKFLRKSMNMTQNQFAESIGITHSTISDIERGKIKTLSKRNIKIISDTYKINSQWLTKGEGEMFIKIEETLDIIAKKNGLTDLEYEVLGLYMNLPYYVRQPLLKELISSITKHTVKSQTAVTPGETPVFGAYEYFDKATGKPITPSESEIKNAMNAIDRANINTKAK